jgi:hypothetical protein
VPHRCSVTVGILPFLSSEFCNQPIQILLSVSYIFMSSLSPPHIHSWTVHCWTWNLSLLHVSPGKKARFLSLSLSKPVVAVSTGQQEAEVACHGHNTFHLMALPPGEVKVVSGSGVSLWMLTYPSTGTSCLPGGRGKTWSPVGTGLYLVLW